MVLLVANKPTAFGLWLEAEIYKRWPDVKEFTRLSGVSDTSVLNWINHGAQPYRKTCYAIARALGIAPAEVLERAGHRVEAVDTEGELAMDGDLVLTPMPGADLVIIAEMRASARRLQEEADRLNAQADAAEARLRGEGGAPAAGSSGGATQ